MPKWHVYVNRAAGRKAAEPAAIRDLLREIGLDFDLHAPDSPDETKALIEKSARSGATHFAVAGGDGTVNLAVNALLPLGLEAPPVIGVLPVGTGCDLLRTFGLPQDVAGAARHLTTNAVYDIDVGTLEGSWGLRYFVNVAQTGVGAAAVQSAMSLGRRLGAARSASAE